ncbi:hypothetical protein R3P38DRAFT_3310010 [Favolaschia claudopus]|uniref:DUF6589 domain-containing protein n=1 Tax=Favolaschia claudopus TaxID=2862362 RepID=A0AAW0CTQ3_9AGAR
MTTSRETSTRSRTGSPVNRATHHQHRPLTVMKNLTPMSESPHVLRTRALRQQLEELSEDEIERRMMANLEALESTGFNLALMLDFLCEGKYTRHNATIRYARTAFMCSDELPNIFSSCLKPPRWSASAKKKRATGGRKALAPVAVNWCLEVMHKEMYALRPLLTTDTATDVRAESLTGFTFLQLHARMSITVTTISQLMYQRSWTNNRLQKTFAIYFKFKGLSAKGFDVLHALGLVMRHSWISKAIRRMSQMTLDELRELVRKYPWVLTYDNVVILFKIFSQRLENLQKLTNGTVATVYLKPGATPLPESANQELKEQRAANLDSPITIRRVLDLAASNHKNHPMAASQTGYYAWLLLAALIHSPDFDLPTYKFKDHTLRGKPPPLNPLPVGEDAKSIQFLLSSINQPEASYSDHLSLIDQWLKQLHMYSKQQVESIGQKKVMAFIGDQLTSNITINGLRSKTPSELVDLATRALSEDASSEALEMMRKRPDRDEIQEFHTQFTRDLLPYLSYVGILEALLPDFLFRFIGGGNTNYQEEALELLNGLNVDWPQSVADFVRQNCWLLTFTNYADNFVAFDQAQEHNIKDIKVTYKPPGPRRGWDYMRILHPAIPTVRANAEFIDREFNALTRGKKHTSPSKEKDIQALLGRLEDAHKFKPGRKLDIEDKPQKRNFKRSTEERAMGGDAKSDVSQDSEHSDEQMEE